MKGYSEASIKHLCQGLDVEPVFLNQCLEESAIELLETENGLDLTNGTVRQMRRLQRLCQTFEIDLPVAALITELSRRVAELEAELNRLQSRSTDV